MSALVLSIFKLVSWRKIFLVWVMYFVFISWYQILCVLHVLRRRLICWRWVSRDALRNASKSMSFLELARCPSRSDAFLGNLLRVWWWTLELVRLSCRGTFLASLSRSSCDCGRVCSECRFGLVCFDIRRICSVWSSSRPASDWICLLARLWSSDSNSSSDPSDDAQVLLRLFLIRRLDP